MQESGEDASTGCMKARLAGTPLQLGILCLAQNLLAPDVLLPDEDGSFYSSVLCENAKKKKKCSLSLGKGGNHPKCAAVDDVVLLHGC